MRENTGSQTPLPTFQATEGERGNNANQMTLEELAFIENSEVNINNSQDPALRFYDREEIYRLNPNLRGGLQSFQGINSVPSTWQPLQTQESTPTIQKPYYLPENLTILEGMEDNLPLTWRFLNSPIIQEIIRKLEKDKSLKNYEWEKEPNDVVIKTVATDKSLRLWGDRNNIRGGEELFRIIEMRSNYYLIETSLFSLGVALLKLSYNASKEQYYIKYKELELAITNYFIKQQDQLKPRWFSFKDVGRSEEELKLLFEKMMGVKAIFQMLSSVPHIASQRLTMRGAEGLESALTHIGFPRDRSQIIASRIEGKFFSHHNIIDRWFFRLFVPLEEFKSFVEENPSIKGYFEFFGTYLSSNPYLLCNFTRGDEPLMESHNIHDIPPLPLPPTYQSRLDEERSRDIKSLEHSK
jgi:hypothetical protein